MFGGKKHSNVKYQGNASCGSRTVPCGEEEEQIDVKTDMARLTVAFHNFGELAW
jgi:hypothetical protein